MAAVNALEDRFDAQAERALEEAARLDPDDCYTARELYKRYRARNYTPSQMPARSIVFQYSLMGVS